MSRKKLVVSALTLILLTQSSCAALIGGAAGAVYGLKRTKNRAEFTAKFNQTNTERESKGLAPLDWCASVYRFDKGWGKQDPACKEKIKAYESGDATVFPQ